MAVKWKESMASGEPIIDKQHKSLIDEINNLSVYISADEIEMGKLRKTLHFLYEYVGKHFSYEEAYMKKHKFPGLEEHKKIHQSFVTFYEDFQKELKEKCRSKNFDSSVVKELLKKIQDYLADWLVKHIMGADQLYVKYIRSHSSKK